MSVAISYSTTRPVTQEVADRLLLEAESLPPLVWYEPIHLVREAEYPSVLTGWSKCAPMGVELDDGSIVEIAEHDWFFMDYWDLKRLLDQLATWSSKHGLVWVLGAEGRRLGKVAAGRPSWGLRRYLGASARRGLATGDPERDAARVEQLRRAYPLSG